MLRKYHTYAGLLGGLALVACGGPEGDPALGEDDLGDIRGVEEIASALTEIGDAEFEGGTLTVPAESKTVVIAYHPVTKAITVNGHNVIDDTTGKLATSTDVKYLNVTASTGTVILDFANGTFLKGDASGQRIRVEFTGEGAFKVRGTKNADTFTVGKETTVDVMVGEGTTPEDQVLVAFDKDAVADIKVINAPAEFTFSLGKGNDVLNGSIIAAEAAKNFGAGAGPTDRELVVYGGEGNDTITGGGDTDLIHGNEGNDTLAGGAGKDVLFGDEGDDVLDEGALGDGDDVLWGGDGTVDLPDAGVRGRNHGIDRVSYAGRVKADPGDPNKTVVDPVVVTIGSSADDGSPSRDEKDEVKADIEEVVGTDGDDVLVAGTAAATLRGGKGDDVLYGGDGDDNLDGGEGNDRLFGGGGKDTLSGGKGNDTLYGFFKPETGDHPSLVAGADEGPDTYVGGEGTDKLTYDGCSSGVIIVANNSTPGTGCAEGDVVAGDIEGIVGTEHDDDITGSDIANTIVGGPGTDVLRGGKGDDTFLSYEVDGADIYIGGEGTDTVDYSERPTAFPDGAIVDMRDGTEGSEEADDANEGDDVRGDIENVTCPRAQPEGQAVACEVIGNALNNVIVGGDGDDVLDGGDGDDEIFGGNGDDTLKGGAGDDTLDGGLGSNTLDCGSGSGDIGFNGADALNTCEL
jgi:Ca2+-binding RTX toxin-like protein